MAWLNIRQRAGPSTATGCTPKPMNPPAIQIHHQQNPVGLEQDGFSPKQIHAPQRVLCVAEQREFEFCKRSMAAQESRGFDEDGSVHQSTWTQEQRAQPKEQAVGAAEIR